MPQSLSNVLLQIGLNDWCLKEMRQRKDFSSPHEPGLKGLQTKLSDALKQKNQARTHTRARTLSAPTQAPRSYLTNKYTNAHTRIHKRIHTQNKGSPGMRWHGTISPFIFIYHYTLTAYNGRDTSQARTKHTWQHAHVKPLCAVYTHTATTENERHY